MTNKQEYKYAFAIATVLIIVLALFHTNAIVPILFFLFLVAYTRGIYTFAMSKLEELTCKEGKDDYSAV